MPRSIPSSRTLWYRRQLPLPRICITRDNFWDMRATGTRLGNCAAEQAEGPFLNPLEHGFADLACAVYRVSQSPYRAFFEQVWGPQSFAVTWPANIEQVCSTPGPAPSG